MIIGNKVFEGYTYIMAIINLTPDSFYKGSRAEDDYLYRAERAVKEGAAVIDLGAQSTRPGYTEVPPEEEEQRLIPRLEKIKRNFDIPVSIDTYFPSVARSALSCGADMINDIWGLSRNDGMAEIIAGSGASVAIMHNARRQIRGDVMEEVTLFLRSAAQRAQAAGISKDKIILDGGIGFAKDGSQSKRLADEYYKLNSLGYPVLMGASRKSFMGGSAEERLPQTLNYTRLAARHKILFVRVHDVQPNAQAIKEAYGY